MHRMIEVAVVIMTVVIILVSLLSLFGFKQNAPFLLLIVICQVGNFLRYWFVYRA